MCDLLQSLMQGIWDVSVRAVSLFLGTALAYLIIIDPVLKNLENFKHNASLIRRTRRIVAQLADKSEDVIKGTDSETTLSQVFHLLEGQVSKLEKHVTNEVAPSLPRLQTLFQPTIVHLAELVSIPKEERHGERLVSAARDVTHITDSLKDKIDIVARENARLSLPVVELLRTKLITAAARVRKPTQKAEDKP